MAYIYDLTDTWNAGGTTFNGIKMNVTDSASAVSSKLVTLQTNGTEHFSVTKAGVGYVSGNLGVGTTSPSAKLHVSDAANGKILISGTSTSAELELSAPIPKITFTDTSGSAADGEIKVDGNAMQIAMGGSEYMRLTSAGLVGIGTASPAQRLDVTGSANSVQARFGNVAGRGLTIGTTAISGTNDAGVVFNAPTTSGHATLIFQTNSAERARIDSSGNLLVGTTSATPAGSNVTGSALLTFGGANLSRTNSITLDTNRDGSDGTIINLRKSGTTVGSISVTASATAYNTSSDYRLKDIDGPVANSGAYIDALKPVQGSWKADGGRFIGLLAHEVQEVSETPIATGEKDGEEMQAMDYSAPELIANLIAEIQSLRARVAQLEGN